MNPESVAAALLRWYDARARRLPWRAMPGEAPPDPYRVWLSEIMLQQTTVAAATPYFEAFTRRWPTVEALAGADAADVMAAWAGLGYYARARNLHACARAVGERFGGRFPAGEEELRSLPGIGPYTAAAIAAIAFGAPATAVDANVERIVARLGAIRQPLPQARSAIRRLAERLTPPDRAGDFAQAMMDLGQAICTPRAPDCPACPLERECETAASGDPAAYPVRPPKRQKPVRHGTAFWLEHAGEVLLVRRPPKGMLGGMRALPTGPWQSPHPGLVDPPAPADWAALGTINHVFTHFALKLDVVAAHALTRGEAGGEWWPIAEIGRAGLPTLFAKAAALARAQREEQQ